MCGRHLSLTNVSACLASDQAEYPSPWASFFWLSLTPNAAVCNYRVQLLQCISREKPIPVTPPILSNINNLKCIVVSLISCFFLSPQTVAFARREGSGGGDVRSSVCLGGLVARRSLLISALVASGSVLSGRPQSSMPTCIP